MWKNGAKSFHTVEKWTAWKPSLQKAATADDARVQTVAGGGDPGRGLNEPGYRNSQQPRAQRARLQSSQQPRACRATARLAVPPRNARQAAQCAAGRADGVEAVPPKILKSDLCRRAFRVAAAASCAEW